MGKRATINVTVGARRVLAWILDVILCVIACAPGILVISTDYLSNHAGPAWHGWLIGVPTLLFLSGEAFWGWTIGRQFFGLSVVSRSGHPIGLGRRLVRFFFKYSPLLAFVVASLKSMFTGAEDPDYMLSAVFYTYGYVGLSLLGMALPRVQRGIHDFIAVTIVVSRSDIVQPRGFEVILRKNPDEDVGT